MLSLKWGLPTYVHIELLCGLSVNVCTVSAGQDSEADSGEAWQDPHTGITALGTTAWLQCAPQEHQSTASPGAPPPMFMTALMR